MAAAVETTVSLELGQLEMITRNAPISFVRKLAFTFVTMCHFDCDRWYGGILCLSRQV